MPPLFSVRMLMLLLILILIGCALSHHLGAAVICLAVVTAIWLANGRQTIFQPASRTDRRPPKTRQARQPEPVLAGVATPRLGPAHDRGLDGCFQRLHPAWSAWLVDEQFADGETSSVRNDHSH